MEKNVYFKDNLDFFQKNKKKFTNLKWTFEEKFTHLQPNFFLTRHNFNKSRSIKLIFFNILLIFSNKIFPFFDQIVKSKFLEVLPSDVPYKISPVIQTWSMDNGVLRLGIQVFAFYSLTMGSSFFGLWLQLYSNCTIFKLFMNLEKTYLIFYFLLYKSRLSLI